MNNELKTALCIVADKINEYVNNCVYFDQFNIKEIKEGLLAYFLRGGKRVRPALALWSCGICGGDINKVISCASGLELCHTWTLIHDDIIDNDDTRRGGDSVHIIGKKFAQNKYSIGNSDKYGETYSILIGDMLHSISVSMILDTIKEGVDPKVVVEICKYLENKTTLDLIEGELLDVQFEYMNLNDISYDLIYRMIEGKTGALIKYSTLMGAMIGLNTCDVNDPKVKALGEYGMNIGLAFQLRDDILGIIADENKLGKPVGSDIVEGKKSSVIFKSIEEMNESDKSEFLSIYGKSNNLEKGIELIKSTNALDIISKEAENLTNKAIDNLSIFPDNEYKSLLISFAEYMLNRDY